ncbi:MAG: hypothetical protein ACI9SE_004292 [Neolewinella sp.]|jgi:hypothetical protein
MTATLASILWGVDLVGDVLGKVRRVTGDGAYDSRALYDAASSRHEPTRLLMRARSWVIQGIESS